MDPNNNSNTNDKNVSGMSVQKKKKAIYRERKEKLLTYMRAIGSWVLPNKLAEKIAEELNISVRQLYRDRLRIIRSVPKPDVKEIAGKFLISYEDMITEAISLKRDEDPEIKIKAIKLFFEAVESYTRFLESYGFKEKMEEKLKISGMISESGEEKLMNILDKYIKN